MGRTADGLPTRPPHDVALPVDSVSEVTLTAVATAKAPFAGMKRERRLTSKLKGVGGSKQRRGGLRGPAALERRIVALESRAFATWEGPR